MVAAPTASWSHILSQVAESLDKMIEKPSAEILRLTPTSGVAGASPLHSVLRTKHSPIAVLPDPAVSNPKPASAQTEPEEEAVSDWMSTLDIISGMAGLADEHNKRLREQSVSHEAALGALQQELKEMQQRLQLSEMRAHEIETRADIRLQKVQADADAQVQEIRAEAEARVRTIRAEADASVRAAEDQARVANLRADTAEKWLSRIDAAAKNLLLGGHMSQAAA